MQILAASKFHRFRADFYEKNSEFHENLSTVSTSLGFMKSVDFEFLENLEEKVGRYAEI